MKIKKGNQLKCMDARAYYELTENKTYIATSDERDGEFESSPFITVNGNDDLPLTAHASRFEIIDICKESK